MFILALLLIAAVVAAGALVIINGGEAAVLDFEFFKVHTTVAGVFLAGAAGVVVLAIAWRLLQMSARRSRRRRAEVKRLRKEARDSRSTAETSSNEPPRDVDKHFDSTPREESGR
jgi:membrane protein implicated in regulation of membrane protease activity